MFFLRKVNFLGHIILAIQLSPVVSHIDEIKGLKAPESTTGVFSILGAMGVYTNSVINYHVDAQPLYELGRTVS